MSHVGRRSYGKIIFDNETGIDCNKIGFLQLYPPKMKRRTTTWDDACLKMAPTFQCRQNNQRPQFCFHCQRLKPNVLILSTNLVSLN